MCDIRAIRRDKWRFESCIYLSACILIKKFETKLSVPEIKVLLRTQCSRCNKYVKKDIGDYRAYPRKR